MGFSPLGVTPNGSIISWFRASGRNRHAPSALFRRLLMQNQTDAAAANLPARLIPLPEHRGRPTRATAEEQSNPANSHLTRPLGLPR